MKFALNLISGIFVLIVSCITWLISTTPSTKELSDCLTTRMHKVKLCEKNKNYVSLSKISSYLKNLVLIAEDSNFYQHSGFDWSELQNSFFSNVKNKKISRGGSTITQQLAKNVFLNFDRTYSRKFREAVLTIQIEKEFSKNEILEKYLNVIEFGPNLFGIYDAAFYYFQKHPADLNLLESAFLVYLIPNPKVHGKIFKRKMLTPYSRFRILDLMFRLYKARRINLEAYLYAKENINTFPWKDLAPLESIPNELTVLPESGEEVEAKFATDPPLEVSPNEEESNQDQTFED